MCRWWVWNDNGGLCCSGNNIPLVVIVLNNHKAAMIKFEQEVKGNIEYGTDKINPNFAQYTEICGGVGYRVEKPVGLFQQNKPCIVVLK